MINTDFDFLAQGQQVSVEPLGLSRLIRPQCSTATHIFDPERMEVENQPWPNSDSERNTTAILFAQCGNKSASSPPLGARY